MRHHKYIETYFEEGLILQFYVKESTGENMAIVKIDRDIFSAFFPDETEGDRHLIMLLHEEITGHFGEITDDETYKVTILKIDAKTYRNSLFATVCINKNMKVPYDRFPKIRKNRL